MEFNPQAILTRLLAPLSDRQRDVIISRAGLNKRGEKLTLAALGDKYGITRERIRQIEASALGNLHAVLEKDEESQALIRDAIQRLKTMGGVVKEGTLLKEYDTRLASVLTFILQESSTPRYHPENDDHHPFWFIDEDVKLVAQRFLSGLEKIIKNKRSEIISNGKFDELFRSAVTAHNLKDGVALNYLAISKKFGVNPYNDFGLVEWPEIMPKTVRDRAYLVLRKINTPLHFTEIAAHINKVKFDHRKAHPQTVHNELIKDGRFVLVGRGMYALAEQGYEPGTAREVVHRVLKKSGPMKPKDIVFAIQKERFFKPNTILLNLQNKKFFQRLTDGTYTVKEV